ncbi:MarR family winged helix-turn-helix transcriptional regulator [Aquabacterium sp. J223]|uniref:MarR family winged helix-turn-helix transcriptional regulator n=1 Tax=Aquabacterium sp. J223 TaxID=2898431 RepID=UPI0021AD95FC|nr:MarR family transcriptional regulator [Aquabacterium sp. J223]UUX95804.1 MarR family transcriptional regulator [Aquabacterium sp. J223]
MASSTSRARPAPLYDGAHYRSSESVGYLMKRIVSSMSQQVDARLAPVGLTNAQWVPLVKLRERGRLPVAEIARDTQMDPGAMTRLLDRLEKKGLCRRDRCTADRRVVWVALTEAGEAAAAALPPVLAEVQNAHLAGLSRAEWQTLLSLLQRVHDNAEALRAATPPPEVTEVD